MRNFLKISVFLSGWIVAGWLAWKTARPEVLPLQSAGRVEEGASGRLEAVFEKWASAPALDGASVALVVLDDSGNALVSSPLAETALCPASSLKTLTTGAALGILGPEFRFETKLMLTPDGNLVLAGGGDPTLTLIDIEKMADDAVAGGLKGVEGNVQADTTVFSGPPVSDHWNWGDIGNAYGAGAYGLNVEHNRMEVSFRPGGKLGEPAAILESGPAAEGTRWANQVTTGAEGSGDGVTIYSEPFGRVISLFGTVPPGAPFTVTGAIADPPAVAVEALRARLKQAGVKIRGNPVPRKGEAVLVAAHRSAPLPEIIDHLHEVSDNLEAQCLFLTLGRLKQNDPATVVKDYWEKAGVPFSGLRLLDGSGLARANMIRPVDLARVNQVALTQPHGRRFYQSLKATHGGQVRSKLGAMSGVKTEVGFLRLPSGKEVTFALMANGLGSGVNFWSLRGELLEDLKRAME